MSPRIDVSDSELEDEETQLNVTQIEDEVEVIQIEEEEEVVKSSRPPSIAWLCFDKSKVYIKNGKEYVKCNQPRCNTELTYNKSTASHLVRHVKKVHQILVPKASTKEKYKQQSLQLQKTKVMPSYSEEKLKEFLVRFFVMEDISFQTVESSAFRELLHFMRVG